MAKKAFKAPEGFRLPETAKELAEDLAKKARSALRGLTRAQKDPVVFGYMKALEDELFSLLSTFPELEEPGEIKRLGKAYNAWRKSFKTFQRKINAQS